MLFEINASNQSIVYHKSELSFRTNRYLLTGVVIDLVSLVCNEDFSCTLILSVTNFRSRHFEKAGSYTGKVKEECSTSLTLTL